MKNGFPVVVDASTLHLPIEAYLPSDQQRRAYATALSILVDDCMAAYGFGPGLKPSNFSSDDALVSSLTMRRYGSNDVDRARAYGYHTQLQPEFVAVERRSRARAREAQEQFSQSPALTRARGLVELGIDANGDPVGSFQGKSIPVGGCTGEANRRLSGSSAGLDRRDEVASRIQVDSWYRAMEDARVQRVFQGWAGCMARVGFRYDNPIDANNDNWGTPRPTAREIAAAVTDAGCSQAENVIGVWHGVEAEIQDSMIEKNAEHLTQVRDDLQAMLSNAEKTLANK